jgi:drug/metabolite transporter (DMT)-like permease
MILGKYRGEVSLLYCAVCWGSTFFLVKGALSVVSPLVLVSYRFLLSAVLIIPFLRGRSVLMGLRAGASLSAFVVVLFVSQTLGLQRTTATNSGFITGLFVLFVPVFMLLFWRRKPRAAEWVAIGLALTGVWVLTGGLQGFNRGDGMTLVAAAAYALHMLLTDRYVKTNDTVVLAFHQFWITGSFVLLVGVLTDASLRVTAMRGWLAVGFLALFPTLSGFFAQMVGQRCVPPIRAALLLSLEPAFAAMFACGLGGEALTWNAVLGGGMIVAATILCELSRTAPSADYQAVGAARSLE